MNILNKRIDFMALIEVVGANPNGDPLNGNRPRQDSEDFGIISAECIKRKIRNVMQITGEKIFVQTQDRSDDGAQSLKSRAKQNDRLQKASKDKDLYKKVACETWLDVRTFGQVFAFDSEDGDGVSISVTGPVQIQIAKSVLPIEITEMQITKSVNSKDVANGKKASDTMGTRAYVEHGLYIVKGSISPYLADKTGFSEKDAETLKFCLEHLFLGDESSSRPSGSMNVRKVIWWEHDSKMGKVSSAAIFNSVSIVPNSDSPKNYDDYTINITDIEGVNRTETDM